MAVNPGVLCEVVSGGKGVATPISRTVSHFVALIYFVTWAVLYGVLLHWPTSMNAWILAFCSAGVGFIVSCGVLATTHAFAAQNMVSNVGSGDLHYTSGLVHVGILVKATLIIVLAIFVPAALQLSYLSFHTTCCFWSGDVSIQFLAAYLISLFYYHFGVATTVQLLYTDLRPVFQVTTPISASAKRK